jgi:hypothetical protein
VIIHSDFGGNCRVRTNVQLTGDTELSLVSEGTENSNLFFRKNPVSDPILADGIEMKVPAVPESYLYDFEATPDTVYHLQGPSSSSGEGLGGRIPPKD